MGSFSLVWRQADAEGRDTWVVTSDGSAFYEAQGFDLLRVVTLGTDNPTYHGEPVKVNLVSVVVWQRTLSVAEGL